MATPGPASTDVAIIRAIIDQHLDQGIWLAMRWITVSDAPHYNLADLHGLEERLAAHIDGIEIGGDEAWEVLCETCVAAPTAGAFHLVAAVAKNGRSKPEVAHIFAAAGADASCLAVLAGVWAHRAERAAWLVSALSPVESDCLRLAIAAGRRQVDGMQAADLAATQPPAVLARAIQAVGELGRVDLYAACRPHLSSDDIVVRFWTAWTLALRTASGESRKTLQWFATARSSFAAAAAALAARRLDPREAQAWLDQLAASHPRLAIQAAGAAGDPVRLPWLLERCAEPALARVAGEAIALITGVDIAFLDLDGEPPAGFTPPGPTDDPADPEVDTDPDEHLPWPDPAKLSRWLSKQSFAEGVRHLCGKPIDAAWCQQVLRDGYQRQRLAAAHELAALDPAAPLFDVTAPAWVQRQRLG